MNLANTDADLEQISTLAMSDPSLNSNGAAAAAVRRLWSQHTHDPTDTSMLDKDFSMLMLPTCAGAQSVDEYKRFYRKYLWAAETNGYFVKKQILQTHYSSASLVEEALYEVHLHEGREDQMQWIVPGVKLNEPGDRKVATVVVVTVVNAATEQGVLLSKRMYWDQASVLKQLGLIQSAGNPSTYGFNANYLLPVLGTPHDKLLSGERDLPFNIFALRLEETQPMSKNTSNDSMSSLLSGTSTPLPMKHGIRLVPGASETSKHSHIFDTVELPNNAFGGMRANPKKYETHLAIVGSGAEHAQSASRDRSRSPSSSGPKSSSKLVDGLFDPLTGDLVRPNVHDPQRHTSHVSNVVFGSGTADDGQDDDGDVFAMHHMNKKQGVHVPKHLESTVDKVLAGSLSTDTNASDASSSRGRNVPRHMQSHFNAGLAPPENSRSEEELYSKSHPGSGKPLAHMTTTLDAPLPVHVVKHDPHFQATLGNPEAEAQWIPGKNKKPNPAMQATSIEEEEQRTRAASPKRAPRPTMETTLDKDEKAPMRKAKPDLVGHDVFGTGAAQEENNTSERPPIKRQYMESHISFGSGEVAGQAPSASPKSAKPHLKSNVFGSFADADKQSSSPVRRSYAEHGMTKSQVKLGDDGGIVGMPPSVPTWGATASVPVASDKRPVSSKRQGPGGHSTIRLG